MIIFVYLLSAVSIIWGYRSRNKVMGQFKNTCPQCKKAGFQTVVRSRRWFTLYFIPLIPFSKKSIARCNLCGFQYALNNNQADSLFPKGQAGAAAGPVVPQMQAAPQGQAPQGQAQQTTQQLMDEGTAYARAGRYAEAIAAFDRVILLTPTYAGAYFNKGNALLQMGRGTEAVTVYDQAIQLAPNVADAYVAKGKALDWLGRKDEAQKAYADGRMYGYQG